MTKRLEHWQSALCVLFLGVLPDYNDFKHRHKHVRNPVPSNFDTREHLDYNIASFKSIVINCPVSSSSNDPSHRP